MKAYDDVSGAHLDPKLVKKARQDGRAFCRNMNAYTRCPRSRVSEGGGNLIDPRPISINQVDGGCPNYRPRLVGGEYYTYKDDSLYAATPPLEALRMILSHTATVRGAAPRTRCRELLIHDVGRAYFYAPAIRRLFIELPEEDQEAKKDEVGRFNVCLYGTRDAARGWQRTLSNHLRSMRCRRGAEHPAVFQHPQRGS